MHYYPKGTIAINRAENGWTVKVVGSRENQEDNLLAGHYVYESIDGLIKFFKDLDVAIKNPPKEEKKETIVMA